jgi:hypothetical protein
MKVHSISSFNDSIVAGHKKIRIRGISNNGYIATMFILDNKGIFKYHNSSFFSGECDMSSDNTLIVKYEEDLLW